MPHYKSVQYSIYCGFCDNLIDFACYRNLKNATRYWRSQGWRKRGGKWCCPLCVAGKKTEPRRTVWN